jgi:hypothetical protein
VIRNTNDGTRVVPYLRSDINYANVKGLPATSSAPQGGDRALHQAVMQAGYRGIQAGDPDLCRELGLGLTDIGRVNQVEDAERIAREKKEKGFECVTLHVGWGMEDDLEVARLVEAVLLASEKHSIPLYIETHRATITQDLWRTVQLARRFPEVRFNGDFSHWYNGLEMVYGGIENKWDFIQPVFERVRFLHGRIATPGSIQVGIGGNKDAKYVVHFREMWTRSFQGFLKSAAPGDYLCFTPELLGPDIYYARLVPDSKGEWVEESDRWEEAKILTRIAMECWEEAQKRHKSQTA